MEPGDICCLECGQVKSYDQFPTARVKNTGRRFPVRELRCRACRQIERDERRTA